MKDFIKILEERFELEKSISSIESKLQFIGDSVFDFTTYDQEISEQFANRMLDVIEAILDKKCMEYQNLSDNNYINYLTMVNMPFLADKIEWGTSIRGAWFDDYSNKTFEIIPELTIDDKELKPFMRALLDWSIK